MKILSALFAAASVLLLGCAAENRSQVQYDFVHKLNTVRDELMSMQLSSAFDKGYGGALPPEDLHQQIAAKKEELITLFQNPPSADLWNASIVSRKRKAGSIIVFAEYGSTLYELRISDPEAKKIAENFRDGDDIRFTGRLMAEGSATTMGAFMAPEFSVYPTKVVRGELQLSQRE